MEISPPMVKRRTITTSNVCDTLDMLIGSIREADPDRFIIYEVTARNGIEETIRESTEAYETIPVRYDNVRISFNFCEITFVYAEMTAAEGASIDFNNHCMFKPEYPVTIYAAMSHIKKGNDLTIDGFLPEGTVIEIYLRNMGEVAASPLFLLKKRCIRSQSGTLLSRQKGYSPHSIPLLRVTK